MTSPDSYVYLFVRQDIPIQQQIIQSNHATLMMASIRPFEGTPNLVLIGVPDKDFLSQIEKKLSDFAIPHYCWNEPDYDIGFSSICTAALYGEARNPLRFYSLWKQPDQVSLSGRAADSNPAHVGSIPTT